MSRVKIVILNWNGLEHLRTFLPSVIETSDGADIVVADNGSTDASVEMLELEYPNIQLLKFDENWGYAEGYNKALNQLEADYFILLNSDVKPTAGWWKPLVRRLETVTDMFAVAPKLLSYTNPTDFEYAGACGGYIDLLGYPFCRGRILSTFERDNGQYDDPRDVFWASGACMAVRADLFKKFGGFDARFFAHMEEIDLCWRAQLYGYRIGVVPESVVYHLGGGTLPNNTAGKLYLNYRNNLAMLRKNMPATRRMWVLPLRMCMDGGSALIYLLQGRRDFVGAVWRAHRDYRRWSRTLKQQREVIRLHTVHEPTTVFRSSILLRYAFGKKHFDNLL